MKVRKIKMRELLEYAKCIVFSVVLVGAMYIVANKCIELKINYIFDNVENREEWVLIHGVYEDDGLILSDDGHEWIYMLEKPLPAGSEVEMVFDTDNKIERKDWDFKAIRVVKEVEERK